MLIQNTVNAPQAAQTARLTSDGAAIVVSARPSGVGSSPPGISEKASAITQRPSPTQLKDAIDNINQAMQKAGQALEFSIDQDTNKPVVRMVDKVTGDVIRQIPSEEMLAISRSIDQFLQHQGLLLSQKA